MGYSTHSLPYGDDMSEGFKGMSLLRAVESEMGEGQDDTPTHPHEMQTPARHVVWYHVSDAHQFLGVSRHPFSASG